MPGSLDFLRTPRFNPLDLCNDNESVLAFNLSYLFHRTEILREGMGRLLSWVGGGAHPGAAGEDVSARARGRGASGAGVGQHGWEAGADLLRGRPVAPDRSARLLLDAGAVGPLALDRSVDVVDNNLPYLGHLGELGRLVDGLFP